GGHGGERGKPRVPRREGRRDHARPPRRTRVRRARHPLQRTLPRSHRHADPGSLRRAARRPRRALCAHPQVDPGGAGRAPRRHRGGGALPRERRGVIRERRRGASGRGDARLTAIAFFSALMIRAVARRSPSPSREGSFSPADGGTVVADLYAAQGSDAVVLAHGAAFDKASWAPFATWLASRGHQVLAIDFRGYGRSTAGTDSRALFEDVLAAVRYLHG